MLSTIALFSLASLSAADQPDAPKCTPDDLRVFKPSSISFLTSCLDFSGQLAETGADEGEMNDWTALCENDACQSISDLDIELPSCTIESKTRTARQQVPISPFFDALETICAPTEMESDEVTVEISSTAYMVPTLLALTFPFLLC